MARPEKIRLGDPSFERGETAAKVAVWGKGRTELHWHCAIDSDELGRTG